MFKKIVSYLLVSIILGSVFIGCAKKEDKIKVWVYTSLYKDSVTDLKSRLEKDFPNIDVQFYQAGSEEVAAKIQAESLSGKIQADIIIASDRFWYEDMAAKGIFLAYKPIGSEKVDPALRDPKGFFTTVSLPIMVMAYNSDAVAEKDAPKSFSELREAKWKDKVSSGSPLASGTNFTTVAFLAKKYGWGYYGELRKNNLIAEGGNSGVIRRLQSKERPVGIVLLENLLRLTESDPRIKMVIPSDGPVIQINGLSIVKKEGNQEATKKVADWMFGKSGQESMVRFFMYATVPGYSPPKGAPELVELLKTAQPWSTEFILDTMKKRDEIKNQFAKIIF
jgi:iron(III) transport system substrate-binding protein